MKITLSEYIEKRNGVPAGNSKSLRNNLYRSLGAKNFAIFWNYWKPIFSYYLGYYIFKPLKMYLPKNIALVFTFLFCGAFHDLVTLLFTQKTAFLFSIWFLLMAFGVLGSSQLKLNFTDKSWVVRSFINLFIIGFCLFLAYYVKILSGVELSFQN